MDIPPVRPQRFARLLEALRLRLSSAEALPQLALLGIVTGFLSGGVIVGFRALIEAAQQGFLPGGRAENFEGLPVAVRLALPAAGGLLLGLVFQALAQPERRVGLVHVIERLAFHQGHLPLRAALVVFFGAAASLVSGQSVGREGPSVHLGAACGSQLGMRLRLPHNTLRSLVGCGVAAAIGASFNTPLAGVVFAMEVVLREYTVAGFAPVILASVSATAVARWAYGVEPTFAVPAMEAGRVGELPWMFAAGLVIGALAAAYNYLLGRFAVTLPAVPAWARMTLGGLGVGVAAIWVPQVMGIGYDTVNSALLGHLGLGLMAGIVVAKLIATTFCLGMGLPGGMIGPTLVIGAAAGGAMGEAAEALLPHYTASPALYAIVGMGAMMGATLQAPLSALTAMLELTGNPNIILPGLLTVITAGLTASEVFRVDSSVGALLHAQGLDYRNDPLAQSLRAMGVAGAMQRNIEQAPPVLDYQRAHDLLQGNPVWIVVIENDGGEATLLPGVDLARHMQEAPPDRDIPLLEIPAQRRQAIPIDLRASLHEAYEALRESGTDAVYVRWTLAPGVHRLYGVLTRQDIEATYGYRPPAPTSGRR